MFEKQIAYFNNNPEGYWFKARLYGWGWTPVKWQGWLVLAVYITAVVAFALTINDDSTTREVVLAFVLPVVLLTGALLRICYKKGERPRWQWGLPKNDHDN